MSPSMPEFEMPAQVDPPTRAEVAQTPALAARPAHTAEPDASADREPRRRGGINWRHVMVAVVAGAVVGAMVPGGIQLAERAAATAEQDGLRAVAMQYLTAIADGRASDATALVPLPSGGRAMPDAVLQSATRITDPVVRLVHIDGDAATIEVEYNLGRPERSAALTAERVDGAWQITSPLFEPVMVFQYSSGAGARIAGIEIPFDTAVQLYPGVYSFDPVVDDPIVSSRSNPFSVDGDRATVTEPYIETTLRPELSARAEAIALAMAEQCRDAGTCAIAADAEVRTEPGTYLMQVSPQSIDISAQVSVTTDTTAEWFQIAMQIQRDAAGEPTAWLCAPPSSTGAIARPVEPCPAVG